MLAVLTCVFVDHDLRLVLVAALICATACAAAFGFHLRSLKVAGTTMAWAWMALTGLVAGSGVWATHFVAMLAYEPTLAIGYAVPATVLSFLIAIVGMGLGFALPVLQSGRAASLTGGVLTGSSVAAMHFTGIAAVRVQAHLEWDMTYVVASVIVASVGAATAFDLCRRLKGRAQWLAPSGALLLAIVGLHFTAMTAVLLVPDPRLAVPQDLVGRGVLALATVALALLILGSAASLIWMERVGRRDTLRGLREALDVVPAGLAFFDPAGRLVSWSRAFGDMMQKIGLPPEEGVGRDAFVAAGLKAGWRPGEDGEQSERWSEHAAGRRVSAAHLRTPDGRWIRHEGFQTPDGGGVTVLTDVTEQQEMARQMAEARDAAEAANNAKSRFLANMSHEIRTPLNGVLGVAEVLAATDLSPKQRELVEVIRSSSTMLNSLLGDVLDLARIEAGVEDLHPEPANLAEVVRGAAGLWAARAEQKGLSLSVEVSPQACGWAACDSVRLTQVLGNLVSNAVKFTPSGQVTVSVERRGDQVAFEVRDTGAGFDNARMSELFGGFQLGDDSSTRQHGGAGLGLAICQHYVRMMGGELGADSAPGRGSTFRFTLDLPRISPPAEISVPAAPLADDEGAGRFRVLVVDDNAVNRQVLGMILDSVGIEHAEAEDGRQGVEATITGGYDVILMDIQMPIMDGFEAIRRIRQWEGDTARPRLPIYIVSANCLQEHVDEGAKAGADGHLSKPVSVAQLIGALEPHAAAALAA